MDENYQTYLNRMARTTLPEAYKSQMQHIQESPKYQPLPGGGREAAPFPGYTIMTPPWEEEAENSAFYQEAMVCQQQLLTKLPPGLIAPLPPESFHFTLADLIWDSAYRVASQSPEFEPQLRDRITQSFHQSEQHIVGGKPVRWQLLGIMVQTRALTLALVPRDEESYEQVLTLRRAIYQNSDLIALGIEQQYRLNAHITLGYFGDIAPDLDRDYVCATLSALGLRWLEVEPKELLVRRADLRKFDDMTRFYREPDWPVLDFPTV